jgi:hypothetical protein
VYVFLNPSFYLLIVVLYGGIVAFTKVLTMYQIYSTLMHPLQCSLSSLLP